MAAALPASLAQAITYGPSTAQAVRRSQYLSDALKAMSESGQKITGGPGELGARLLAFAILNRANDKAQAATLDAVKADQAAQTESLMAGLRPPPADPALPAPQAPAPPQPAISGPTPLPAAQPAGSAANLSDADRRALAQMVWGEARGEGPEGQRAAAAVALNRSRMAGKPVAEIIAQPRQFDGYNARSRALGDADLAAVQANLDPLLSGQVPDPTGGADHFYNPQLASPRWGGPGQDIGNHRFLSLGFAGQRPGPQVAQAPPEVPDAQPYQIASAGPTPPPPQPSAPGSSPPAAGGPPAAVPPQAAAAGGSPFADWPRWRPTPEQVSYVEGLLQDPRTHQQGVQMAMQLRQKMAEPLEATVQTFNGVPVYVAKDPASGAPIKMIPIPPELMTRHVDGAQVGMRPGTQVDLSPTGQRSVVEKPPEGYQASGPNGALAIQRGGPAAIDVERQLRTDFEKSLDYRAYRRAAAIFDSMKRDFGTPGRIADINFVYGLATIFDPDSVVREGEQVVIRNSQSIPDWLVGQINRVNGGQGILPETRAQMLETAGTRLGSMGEGIQERAQYTAGVAQRYGVDPRNAVPPLPDVTPWERPQAMPGAPGGGGQVPDAARRTFMQMHQGGKIDETKPWGSPQRPVIAVSPERLKQLDRPENRGMHVILPDGSLGVIE